MYIDDTIESIIKILEKTVCPDKILAKRTKIEQAIAMYAQDACHDASVARESAYICASIKD